MTGNNFFEAGLGQVLGTDFLETDKMVKALNTHILWKWAKLFSLLLLCILSSCAGNYGAIKFNPDLVDQYKQKNLPEDYNYYYCGRSGLPYAVVGIDPAYKFDGKFWSKIETREEIYNKIYHLWELYTGSNLLYGSDILYKGGMKLGIWFSHYRYSQVKLDAKTKTVTVFNPYNPNHDGWDW